MASPASSHSPCASLATATCSRLTFVNALQWDGRSSVTMDRTRKCSLNLTSFYLVVRWQMNYCERTCATRHMHTNKQHTGKKRIAQWPAAIFPAYGSPRGRHLLPRAASAAARTSTATTASPSVRQMVRPLAASPGLRSVGSLLRWVRSMQRVNLRLVMRVPVGELHGATHCGER